MSFINKRLILLSLALVFLRALATQAAEPQWDMVYRNTQSRIPVIFSAGYVCSGALIEKKIILTAAHCVDRMRPIYVYFGRDIQQMQMARLAVLNRHEDLALIELSQNSPLEPLPIMTQERRLSEGLSVATIGHPVTLSKYKAQQILESEYVHVISSGIVSRVSHQGFVSDMSVSPGNSGGPVFNPKGEIVGVVSKKRIDRFVGDLGYFSSHHQIHKLLKTYQERSPKSYPVWVASSQVDAYLLYSSPSFRKNREGKSKSYYNIGLAVDAWDRLRLFIDTNLDTKEAFTQYGMGWNFYIQASDPIQHYRIIPTIETLKFRYKEEDETEIEKHALGFGLTLKASWFPFYLKGSVFEVNQKSYQLLGLGLSF